MMDQWNQWLGEAGDLLAPHVVWLALALALVVTVSLIVIAAALRHAWGMRRRFRQAVDFARDIRPDHPLEDNLDHILTQISKLIDAPTYVFYIHDANKQNFVLKAVRHREESFGKVQPSYSGLVEYKKEQYMPPLAVKEEEVPDGIRVVKAGEVSLLAVPIGNRKGLIRIGPLSVFGVKKQAVRMLGDLTRVLEHTLEQFLVMESIRTKADVVVSTGEALRRINHVARDSAITADFVLKQVTHAVTAAGAFFCIQDGERHRLINLICEDEARAELEEQLGQQHVLESLIGMAREQGEVMLLTPRDEPYYRLPPELAALGAEAYVLVNVSERRSQPMERVLVLWYNKEPDPATWPDVHNTLRELSGNMREVLATQATLKQFSGIYVHILKTLATLQDNLSPYTVGYSELMSRYAVVIAKEMGLDDGTIFDISLAAYLSNIGVLGISASLVNKEGRYSEEEYELMKLHADVGASIVESTLGNHRVASYILHHHERMDGNGYPAGISGEDIPVGARIIGVVQTFLAMINGRKHRKPLAFEQAMERLVAASGTQLDGRIVEIFVNWFREKQQSPNIGGRALGVCWEMLCTPSAICESCPAYRKTDRNCWEFETNNCASHGKECQSCMVYTETLSRKAAALR